MWRRVRWRLWLHLPIALNTITNHCAQKGVLCFLLVLPYSSSIKFILNNISLLYNMFSARSVDFVVIAAPSSQCFELQNVESFVVILTARDTLRKPKIDGLASDGVHRQQCPPARPLHKERTQFPILSTYFSTVSLPLTHTHTFSPSFTFDSHSYLPAYLLSACDFSQSRALFSLTPRAGAIGQQHTHGVATRNVA